jgi:phage terminase large subunit-like protein
LTFAQGESEEERRFQAIWRYWAPEARRADLDERTGGQASVWAREGFLEFTEGDVIDYRAIVLALDQDARDFDIVDVAYDRWGTTQLSQILTDEGLVVMPMGQGFASMSPPIKAWEGLLRSQRYSHGGNPVTRWMADCVRARSDPAGNLKFDRARSTDRIDGMVAGAMSLDRALRAGVPIRSIYESRGLATA